MSASALLDLYRIFGARRAELEYSRRPESVSIRRDGLPDAVICVWVRSSANGKLECRWRGGDAANSF
jgi:hypothetical protein